MIRLQICTFDRVIWWKSVNLSLNSLFAFHLHYSLPQLLLIFLIFVDLHLNSIHFKILIHVFDLIQQFLLLLLVKAKGLTVFRPSRLKALTLSNLAYSIYCILGFFREVVAFKIRELRATLGPKPVFLEHLLVHFSEILLHGLPNPGGFDLWICLLVLWTGRYEPAFRIDAGVGCVLFDCLAVILFNLFFVHSFIALARLIWEHGLMHCVDLLHQYVPVNPVFLKRVDLLLGFKF